VKNEEAGRSMELPAFFDAPLMADHRVLQSKFFLLQSRQQIIVGVNSSLFGIDLRVERGMLG
jgi:hypothetical protein